MSLDEYSLDKPLIVLCTRPYVQKGDGVAIVESRDLTMLNMPEKGNNPLEVLMSQGSYLIPQTGENLSKRF